MNKKVIIDREYSNGFECFIEDKIGKTEKCFGTNKRASQRNCFVNITYSDDY
jgi:hypothetical protein